MTGIHVDTDDLRELVKTIRSTVADMDTAKNEVAAAIDSATGYDGQLRSRVIAIAGDDPGLARTLMNDLEELARVLGEIAAAFEVADSVAITSPDLGAALDRAVDDGLRLTSLPSWIEENTPFPEWFVEKWDKRAGKYRSDSFEELYEYLKEFASSTVPHMLGTEEDMWNAFAVFLFMKGAIENCPDGEVWRSGAKSAGVELDEYVASVTGVKEAYVEAWLKAGATHGFVESTTIGEMAEMAKAGETIEEHFGFSTEGNWTEGDKDDIVEAVLMVSNAMADATPDADTSGEVFRSVFDGIEFNLDTQGPESSWSCSARGDEVACLPRARDRISPQTIGHELGHSFNAQVVNNLNRGIDGLNIPDHLKDELRKSVTSMRPYGQLGDEEILANIDGETIHVAGQPPRGGYERTDRGYESLGPPWQQHSLRWGNGDPSGNTPGEDFADMFLGWAYDGFADDPAGHARYEWMDGHMATWIEQASQPAELSWFEDPLP